MEAFLNLAWTLLAIASICAWARFERRTGAARRMPMIALVLLLAVLFPVISVSDDIWAIQNPAEADSCLRRSHAAACPHCILPPQAAFPPLFLSSANAGKSEFRAQAQSLLPRFAAPALSPVENRPPPAA